MVFDSVGRDILDNAFQGYNACIFAYGQTGNFPRFSQPKRAENPWRLSMFMMMFYIFIGGNLVSFKLKSKEVLKEICCNVQKG